MDWYLILKFLHVSSVIIWIGGAFIMVMLGVRAERSANDSVLVDVVRQVAWAADRIYVPASISTLVFGLILAWYASLWANLWIILGLLGVASTVGLGVLVLSPLAKKADAGFRTAGASSDVVATSREILDSGQIRSCSAVYGHRGHGPETRCFRLGRPRGHGVGAPVRGVFLAGAGVVRQIGCRGITSGAKTSPQGRAAKHAVASLAPARGERGLEGATD